MPVITIIGIYSANYAPVLSKNKPLKANIKVDSKLMDHPIETGALITDHRIQLPIEIDLPIFLTAQNYKDVYAQIQQLQAAATYLIVQTRAAVYQNMVIQGFPHEETAEKFNAITVFIKLREIQNTSGTTSFSPANPNYTSTQSRGAIQGTPPPANVTRNSAAYNLFLGG